MTRAVKFHGKVVVHPGAEAFVDVSGMVRPSVDETRIAGIIAEAPHGQPGVVHVFADAESARQFFGAGSTMADAILLLQKPSNDERVNGGAAIIYAYKPNRSTQAERWLVQDPVTGPLTKNVSSNGAAQYGKDYTGATTLRDPMNAYVQFADAGDLFSDGDLNGLIVEVISGWGKGQQRQIDISEKVGGAGSDYRLYLRSDLDWDVTPHHSINTPTIRIATPQVKLMADEWGPRGLENEVEFGPSSLNEAFELASKYAKRIESTASPFGGLLNPTMFLKFDPTGGGSLSDWTNPTNWLIPLATDPSGGAHNVEGTTTAGASATSLDDVGGVALTDDLHNNRWVVITGGVSGNAIHAALLGKMFKVKRSVASTGTLELYGAGLGSAPGAGLEWKVVALTDAYFEMEGEEGTAKQLKIYIQDSVNFNDKLADVDLTPITSLTSLIQKLNDVPGVVATLGDGVDGSLLPSRFDFGQRSEHYGRHNIGVVDTTGALLTGTVTVGVGSPNVVGVGTLFTTELQPDDWVLIAGEVHQILSITDPLNLTLKTNHVAGAAGAAINVAGVAKGGTSIPVNATAAYEGGAAFPTTAGGVLLPFPLVIGEGEDNEEIVWVSANAANVLTCSALQYSHPPTDVLARTGNGEVVYRIGSQLIYGPGETGGGYVVRDNCQKTVDWVTTNIGRFLAERATTNVANAYEDEVGASHAENDRDVFKKFYHGEEGTSVVQKPDVNDPQYPVSWEHGMELLLQYEEILVEVPCASSDLTGWATGSIDTLTTLFQNHLKDCDDNRAERQGYIGRNLPLEAGTFAGVVYSKGLLEWIRFLNDESMHFVGQTTKVTASDGVEKVLPPWAFACQAAGIRLGTPLGEPSTLKRVKTSALGQPFNDWDPKNPLDQKKALYGGLYYGEPKKGFWRIVRDYTTHVATDNLARTDGNVWEIRNYVKKDLREKLEERFGGRGVGTNAEGVRARAPVTVASVREYTTTILEDTYRAEGIIVDSEDENKVPIHAYTGLSVRIVGDICYVKIQVFPKTGINFILIDFTFQIPRQSS